jgi:hypothetical protein
MKTVYDLIRHHTCLVVICGTARSAVINNRFLSRLHGMMKPISELRFVCRRCRSQRYRLRLVPDHLGENHEFCNRNSWLWEERCRSGAQRRMPDVIMRKNHWAGGLSEATRRFLHIDSTSSKRRNKI